MLEYEDYSKGYNLTNRIPLYIKPKINITTKIFMDLMRDHYQGEWLDSSSDVGAQAFHLPYRWDPLVWGYRGGDYLDEYAISTFRTGYNFVAQMRGFVDDTSMSCHIPICAGLQKCPFLFAIGNGGMMDFTFHSAFWIFNLVANWAYTRYNIIYPEVRAKIDEIEYKFISQISEIDAEAMTKYKQNVELGIEYISQLLFDAAEKLVADWYEFFLHLLGKYIDGGVKTANYKSNEIRFPGYGKDWYKRIVDQTGDHYLIPKSIRNKNEVFDTLVKMRKI